MKETLGKILRIFTTVLMVLSICMMIFTVISVLTFNRSDRQLFGYRAFIVLSDSMSATDFKAGDLVLTRDVDPATLQPGDIIVAGPNFGCGSSREHAPLAIKSCGVKCVIAPSFARIFYRNAINIGFPIMECAQAAEEIQAGDQVEVDFATGVITDETTGKTYQAAPFPEFIDGIIKSGGLLNSLKDRGVAK